jgi:hypothetical protein
MNIPFFPNTGDGTHCFQAALKMALAHLLPEREFSYEFLDEMSGKKPGKWTWPTAAMLWLIEEGFEIGLVEEFDYREFVNDGGEYLLRRYGREVGEAQIKNSDIEYEREIAKRFIDIAPIEYRIPNFDDLKKAFSENSVSIIYLNAQALLGISGYSGHFIVVCDVDEKNVRLHDPGLPPRPNLIVSCDVFNKAWGYPTIHERNLLFMRKLKLS